MQKKEGNTSITFPIATVVVIIMASVALCFNMSIRAIDKADAAKEGVLNLEGDIKAIKTNTENIERRTENIERLLTK